MKTNLDCIPCFMQQALNTARLATSDETKIKKVLDNIGSQLKDIPMHLTPAETGQIVYREVKNVTGVTDPYKALKKAHIQEAKVLVPELKKMLEQSDDPLLTAIRIAIAGNVIDLGINKTFNLVKDVEKILSQPFAVFDFKAFRKQLNHAQSILYLGDNCGESVFDKILIEQLNKPVTFAVRSAPIINDVTMEEAIESGLDEVASLVESGCVAPGTILSQCTDQFMEIYHHADLIISKGQGNYEGLSEAGRPIFFLLKAKCHVIAKDLDVNEGDIVLKGINL